MSTPAFFLILLFSGLVAGGTALAATVTVQVRDAAGKALADAAVFLESPAARAAVKPGRNVAIAQEQRQFTPRVTLVTVGTPVAFPNRDTVRHHVYSFSPVKTFELKLYAGTPTNPVLFDRVGIAVLGCNIHDNMAAWVVVLDTPYHGRTGPDGSVTLEGVPADSYRLRAWHPSQPVGAPALERALGVAAAGVSVDLQLHDARP